MKITKSKILIAVFGVMCLGFCYTQNTSAAHITDAWVNWNSGIDSDGGTTFGVGLSFGNCDWCEQYGSFRCTSPGYGYTTSICSWDESWIDSDSTWDYYWVDLYPCDDSEQNIGGHFKSHKWYELKSYARRNDNGHYLNGGKRIYYDWAWAGDSAWAKSKGWEFEGFTFANWGVSARDMSRYMNTSDNKTRNIKWVSLNWDQDLDAYYDRNEFAGRAYVTGGGSADTGWQETNNTVSTEMDCANNGCKPTFYLSMKTIKGAGKSPYTIEKSVNGGGWTYVTSGTAGSASKHYTVTLKPGESACYRIVFRPYGSHSNTATVAEAACMNAKVTNFQGKVTVSGATSGNTGWRGSNYSQNFYINNCSPTAGCKVNFAHALKRTNSIGSTAWTVNRYSNLITSTRAITAGKLGNGTFNTSEATVKTTGAYTLYPGMVLCERISFKPNNSVRTSVSDVYVQACASALGDAQPGDPNPDTPENPNAASGDTSFINIKVRNQNVAAFSNYQREVYAKPTDVLQYRSTYNPVLQYTYYLKPQKMQIDGGTVYNNSGTVPPDGSTLASMFNAHKSPGWNNDYSVFSANFTMGQYSQNFNFTNGSMTKQSKTNSHTTQGNEVGSSLNETAKTNNNNSTKPDPRTTPSQVRFTYNSDRNLANVITTPIERTAYARVPYNFINTTEVTTNTDKPLYAGEDASFDFKIHVNPRTNNTTSGTYATIVRGAKWKLELCYNNNTTCQETTPTSTQNSMGNTTIGDLNSSFNYNGTTTSKSIHVNIPDAPAGSDVCIRSAVYPANSGYDRNWQDAEGSHTWAYSPRVCYKVAKKPNLEVWGGNIFSRGALETAVSIKGNLAYYNEYKIEMVYGKDYDKKRVFGSWGEDGVVSSGAIKGLSSGAGLGFVENNSGSLWPDFHPANGLGNNANINGREPGGSKQTTICGWSSETFANYPCTNLSVGALGNSVAANSATSDKSSIISAFAYGGDVNIDGGIVRLNDDGKLKVKNRYYYYTGNDTARITGKYVDGTDSVRKGTIQIVQSNRNINIAGDLIYGTEGGYKDFDEMPKLVIYAKENINIDCGVSRIDAILVAGNTVTTCGDSNDINAQANSNQLVINGAVISNSLKANRTYGAATGANSMIPAEIINFDPTLYLWAGEKSEAVGGSAANLDITYSKELAPRL
ncbi:hypothetical protein IKF21_02125 [Candidatus Saccharibacteria bacterium]|nr:hypothetical protein [Candidatus Saccharibacteria bacterium]